jgi:hypothetical protein
MGLGNGVLRPRYPITRPHYQRVVLSSFYGGKIGLHYAGGN